jgi:pantoate--beta-alanine ligase
VYLGARRRAVGPILYKALQAAEAAFAAGKRDRADILSPANRVTEQILSKQKGLEPSQRALFEIDYISLADPESLDEIDLVNAANGAILSTAVRMLPLEDPQPGEDCGLGSGATTVRLIDNLILQPQK